MSGRKKTKRNEQSSWLDILHDFISQIYPDYEEEDFLDNMKYLYEKCSPKDGRSTKKTNKSIKNKLRRGKKPKQKMGPVKEGLVECETPAEVSMLPTMRVHEDLHPDLFITIPV